MRLVWKNFHRVCVCVCVWQWSKPMQVAYTLRSLAFPLSHSFFLVKDAKLDGQTTPETTVQKLLTQVIGRSLLQRGIELGCNELDRKTIRGVEK